MSRHTAGSAKTPIKNASNDICRCSWKKSDVVSNSAAIVPWTHQILDEGMISKNDNRMASNRQAMGSRAKLSAI